MPLTIDCVKRIPCTHVVVVWPTSAQCALSSIAIAQDLVDEHVQESLAKHCMEEQGDPQGALPHYMAVLRHPSSTLAAQTQHMTKFLEAVLQSEEAAVRTCCGMDDADCVLLQS